MSIVFDEVQGVVTTGPETRRPEAPAGAPPSPHPPDPETIARAIRILTQRKARLFAD